MLSAVWVIFLILALLCGGITGRLEEVTAAVTSGATEGVTLAIGIAGLMCFWSGIMELLQASGLTGKIACFMTPLLRPLFGRAASDRQAMEAVSANVTANLFGLSNAATPLGLRAVERLYTLEGRKGTPDIDHVEFRFDSTDPLNSSSCTRNLWCRSSVRYYDPRVGCISSIGYRCTALWKDAAPDLPGWEIVGNKRLYYDLYYCITSIQILSKYLLFPKKFPASTIKYQWKRG